MARIEIYSKEWFPCCSKAKSRLRAKGLEYREIDITHDETLDFLETNDRGEIRVSRELDTGVHGIFAAGDVTDGPDKKVIAAAGEGARAALAAFTYLLHQARSEG